MGVLLEKIDMDKDKVVDEIERLLGNQFNPKIKN
jgi:hypothetical protein